MPTSIDSEMSVIELENYDEDITKAIQSLRVVKKQTPRPGPGQVLVRMEASPCNPSDLVFLQGVYGVKRPLPVVPGWEGAGTVVASGGGLISNWLKGKRVACSGQADSDGTWAEYYIAHTRACVPLRKGVSFKQGASLIINPLTAWALVERALKGGHQGIVQTAAASQLGRMVLRLAIDAQIPLINIVRRKDQEDILRSLGAEYVLNSESENFEDQLQTESHRLKATICFDAVYGEMTGKVFNAMPARSIVLVYGALSHAPGSGIEGGGFIFGQKKIQGFWLSHWVRKAGFFKGLKASGQIQKRIEDGSFTTEIRQQIKLEDVPTVLIEYYKQMTAGKILIVPKYAW